MPVVLASVAYAQTREAGADQKRAREILETLLKDKNPETRTQAVQALGLVSPTEPYLSELASAMDDKDVEVQVAAISAMVRCVCSNGSRRSSIKTIL